MAQVAHAWLGMDSTEQWIFVHGSRREIVGRDVSGVGLSAMGRLMEWCTRNEWIVVCGSPDTGFVIRGK